MKVRSEEGPSNLCSSPPAFGEIRASKRGVKPSFRKVQPASPQHQAKSAASLTDSRKGAIGSRAWHDGAKAMEGVKRLEMQPRRTRRRRGRGMVGQSSWKQERPVSAPAVRPLGCQPRGGLGATNPISGVPDEVGESGAGVGGGHSSDEGVDNRTRRSEGPLAERAAQRRGSGIAERLFTRRTTSRRDGCWDAGPTPVAGRNAARRLLGGEPCAGESHARF